MSDPRSSELGRREFLTRVALGAASTAVASCADPRARRPAGAPPNVLLIVADDLGIDVLGRYGGVGYDTPHIDRLADEGTRFENVYSTPLCTPSRVQLLTGRYPFRTGWIDNIQSRFEPDSTGPRFLDPREPTFARLLKQAGYRTAVAGKWQLCRFDERPDHVLECGFDEYCCWLWMEASEDGAELVQTSRYWRPSIVENGAIEREIPHAYGPDLYTEYLIEFMRRNRDRPFLAFYPMALPHPPFQPTPRQLDARAVVKDPPSGPEYFRAMVEYLDCLVGRLVTSVEELGLAGDTLVVFTADNGTPPDIHVRFRGQARSGAKGVLSEAGTRVPLIARWPGVVAPGRVDGALVDLSDFLPTLAELAGVGLPSDVPIDGRSFLSVLQGNAAGAREWAASELRESACVRGKRWKLYDDGRLFDVVDDPFEARDRGGDPETRAIQEALTRVLADLRRS